MWVHPFPWHPTFHKIRIWLSSNPSWIIIRLGNTGNQGMQHSSYPWTPYISIRGRKKRVKTPTPCEDHTPWETREYHWETWISFENLAKLRARNLNKQQKTFRWRLFSPSTAQDQEMQTNTPHPPEPLVWANLLIVYTGRVICCAQGTCRVWTLMQLLIHRASV